MHRLQHAVPVPVDVLDPQARGAAPGQEDDAARALRGHDVDDLLRERLPALLGVRVGRVRANRQAGVEQQHPAVGPGGQEAGLVGRGPEGRVVDRDALEDVVQRRRGDRWGADGEAEAVGLVDVMIGVLADDHRLNGVEGRVLRPVNIAKCLLA